MSIIRGQDTPMSIQVYEGSMLSVRSNSRNIASSNGLRYKSALTPINQIQIKPSKPEIKWKSGKLDKKYECNYCGSYLKYPILFQDCRHRVCSSCLTEILKLEPDCPTCGLPIKREKVTIDNEFQKEIQNLPVYCSSRQYGCQWEGTFKMNIIHYEECEYIMVDCIQGCGLKHQRRLEKKHFEEECLKNDALCEFCRIKMSKADEAAHYTICPKFIVPCPAECGAKEIAREFMADHLERDCTKFETPCPFVDSGCEFKSIRGEMPKHLKEAPGIHLNLLCKTISLQKKQMQILTDIIEKQKDQLTNMSFKLNTLEKFYGSQLIWKIDNYAEKFNDCKTGKKPTIFSPPFLTSRHGYKLALSAALYGDGKAKGKYMSLFMCICKGDYDNLLVWPFSHKITFTLLDQCEEIQSRRHVAYTIKPNTCKENMPFLGRPTGDRNASFGAQKFVELEVLNSLDYISDDSIYIKVEIDPSDMVLL